MPVQFFLTPYAPHTMRGGRVVLASTLMRLWRPGEGRVTVLKLNSGAPRWCLARYEATATQLALADSHPLVLSLPRDRDGRMSIWARMALERVGILARGRTSIRDAARLILAAQRQLAPARILAARADADPARIVLAGEVI